MVAENTSAGGDAGRGRVYWSAANSRLEIINKMHLYLEHSSYSSFSSVSESLRCRFILGSVTGKASLSKVQWQAVEPGDDG